MPTSPHDIDATRIAQQLTTHTLGRTLQHVAITTSTNDEVRIAATQGSAAGLVVVADHQTKGRGQHGRSWHDTPQAQLLASVLLRPHQLAPRYLPYLVNAFVLVLADTLAPLVTAPVTLKWPNDVLIAGRKVAGVLCEARMTSQQLTSVCIGWGVNVTAHPHHTSDGVDLAQHSTAISAWADTPVQRADLLIRQLNAFEVVYDQLMHDPTAVQPRWHAAMQSIVGQTRTIQHGSSTIHGQVTALNDDGSIVIAGETVYSGMILLA